MQKGEEVMDTRKCAKCGAEFAPRVKQQRFCSPRCQRAAESARYYQAHHQSARREDSRHEAAVAWDVSAPVPLDRLMRAVEKPPNTSAARWRIELRRRANPDYYAAVGM